MISLPSKAILGGAAVLVLALAGASVAPSPVVVLLVVSALACVAFVAQGRHLNDEDRLVYRPVYARRQSVQRRVRSQD